MELYREYELKFYLNAQHYILLGGHKGDNHPHTWEFSLNIRIESGDFTPFAVFEEGINRFLAPYQNRLLNQVPPFDSILPTLENMLEYFSRQFHRIIHDVGGRLIRVKASEGPSRAYILDLGELTEEPEAAAEKLGGVVDSILDDIISGTPTDPEGFFR